MALPGESEGRRRAERGSPTIGLGAKPYCPDCNKKLELEVCRSGAGYYIGTQCCCGPYTRESVEYYRVQIAAEVALKDGTWTPRG